MVEREGVLRIENFINFEDHSTDCADCIDLLPASFFCQLEKLYGEIVKVS